MRTKPGMFDRIDRAIKPILWACGIYVIFAMVIPAIRMMLK